MKEFQVDITDEEDKDINELIEKCKAKDRKDLFFNAIAFFDWAVDEILGGKAIASIDEEDKTYRKLTTKMFKRLQK